MAKKLPLLIGGVGLIKGSVKGLGPVLSELSYEFSEILSQRNWLASAPFETISLIVRYGEVSKPDAEIGRVNRHGEIEVTVQASLDELRATRGNLTTLKNLVLPYVVRALNAVGGKYNLDSL